MTRALHRASEERAQAISPTAEIQNSIQYYKGGRDMRKSWFTWAFIIVAVVAVFTWFNYQGGKDAVSLSEIFPDEEAFPVDVEYEFVEEDTATQKPKELPVAAKTEPAAVTTQPQTASIRPSEVPITKKVNFTIQIASFKDEKRAQEALTKIRANVPSAYIGTTNLGEKGTWYRIYAGQFERRNEAEVTLNNIKQNYDSSFIITPKSAK